MTRLVLSFTLALGMGIVLPPYGNIENNTTACACRLGCPAVDFGASGRETGGRKIGDDFHTIFDVADSG